MAVTERIIYQPYVAGGAGRLVPGKGVPCRNPEEAVRREEKALAGGRVLGAHVVRVMADEDAGDYGDPEYLTALGTVPEPE